MDHQLFARLQIRQLSRTASKSADAHAATERLSAFLSGSTVTGAPHASISSLEAALNCAKCHSNQDQHRGFFGTDCAQCHDTASWSIAGFRHPSPSSTDCAQCHQAPPSHYMMHFEMVSMKVARQEHAQVRQCYVCHQTTSWNDIKGVGFYKHH
jgi:Zn finger protein HypA/HybF involved in hydrogenase expression